MDLFLMILRFLFGMPAEAEQVELILVHADGRTSNGRQWLASQRDIQDTIGAPTRRPRILHWDPAWLGNSRERAICFWRSATSRSRPRPKECRNSRI